MEHTHTLLPQLLVIIATTVFFSAILRKLKLPPILLYLAVGVLIGPTSLGLIQDQQSIYWIAEFGVVFLLFTLGLEFSLPKLFAVRKTVFGLGSAQMLICVGLFFWVVYSYGVTIFGALITAVVLAVSSTAIVSKELTQTRQLNTRVGQLSIGILLFQDLVAVLFLSLIPVWTAPGPVDKTSILETVLKTSVFILAILAVGRKVLPALFQEVAKTRSEEFFVLTVLMVALMSAYLTQWVGLSMTLGAFIAGMLLGESHYKHQIESDIRPFRDVLLGIFFVSIGAMLDLNIVQEYWLRIIFFTAGLLIFKTFLICVVTRLFQEKTSHALQTGLILSQGGEFGFVLLALGAQHELIPYEVNSFALSIVILSMALSAGLIRHNQGLINKFFQTRRSGHEPSYENIPDALKSNHVLICGYGRIGQTIARFLNQVNIAYIAVDDDPVRVNEAAVAGEQIVFGDCRTLRVLEPLGLDQAKLVVISFDQFEISLEILRAVRLRHPTLPILVRTRDTQHLEELLLAGATEVIPETLEASLMLVSHVMMQLKVPDRKVSALLKASRQSHYNHLHSYYLGEQSSLTDASGNLRLFLHPIPLTENAHAVGKSLETLALNKLGVTVEAIRHQNGDKEKPEPELVVQAGDILILQGTHEHISAAETRLIFG